MFSNKIRQKTTWAGLALIMSSIGSLLGSGGGAGIAEALANPEVIGGLIAGASLVAAPEEQ